MKYYLSHINTAKKIIEGYKGEKPLSAYLKFFFAAAKKYGAKDRKQIAAFCYNYFRLGKAVQNVGIEEGILLSVFLCNPFSFRSMISLLKPEWEAYINLPVSDKISFLRFPIEKIFPWHEELSEAVDATAFALSFLHQPNLFIRIRPGKKEKVMQKLRNARFAYQLLNDTCLSLPNSSKAGQIICLDEEAVVQDYNSQRVFDFLANHFSVNKQHYSVWDCCAASGGKSILLYDILDGKVNLTVSDIRESILFNLKKRFSAAGIKKYEWFVSDLNVSAPARPLQQYPLIICDVPCTGSGTWGRTPEQLSSFTLSTISYYATKQQNIVSNVVPFLQQNGLLVYITCSVFKEENEKMVSYIQQKFSLQLLQMQLLTGYDKYADTMFVAIFKNG